MAVRARLGDAEVRFSVSRVRRIMLDDGEEYQRLKAQAVLVLARSIAPKKTGRLRASHELQRRPGLLRVTYAVVNRAPYASFVHAGRHPYGPMKAQPWLREALRGVDI